MLRTRLRQPSVNGVARYTGLWQTLRLVLAEEGPRMLYSGHSAHLMRVVPNAVVMYSIYESVIAWGGASWLFALYFPHPTRWLPFFFSDSSSAIPDLRISLAQIKSSFLYTPAFVCLALQPPVRTTYSEDGGWKLEIADQCSKKS